MKTNIEYRVNPKVYTDIWKDSYFRIERFSLDSPEWREQRGAMYAAIECAGDVENGEVTLEAMARAQCVCDALNAFEQRGALIGDEVKYFNPKTDELP